MIKETGKRDDVNCYMYACVNPHKNSPRTLQQVPEMRTLSGEIFRTLLSDCLYICVVSLCATICHWISNFVSFSDYHSESRTISLLFVCTYISIFLFLSLHSSHYITHRYEMKRNHRQIFALSYPL